MSDPRQRLFFALWPDEEVRAGLAGLARSLPEHKGRSPHPLDQHVTLVFRGELDAVARECAERVAGALHGEPFDLAIDRVGYWPRPRILWCGPSVTPEPLLQLGDGHADAVQVFAVGAEGICARRSRQAHGFGEGVDEAQGARRKLCHAFLPQMISDLGWALLGGHKDDGSVRSDAVEHHLVTEGGFTRSWWPGHQEQGTPGYLR